VQRRGLSAEDPEAVQKYIRLTLAMSFYSPEIRDRIVGAMGRTEYNSRLEVLEKEAEAHDLTAELKALSMPVLVATGRFDANVAPRTAWTLHQAIPRSKLVVFERSGHFPMLEEPEAFVAVLEEFLRQSRDPAA
ncbi:MAG: alpha/beta fold hydrolase, partial [Terriglobales bacterium]